MVQALEMKAQIDGKGQLIIEKPILTALNKNVKIIVLFEQEEDEFDEATWLRSLSVNPAFDFLNNEVEDISTLNDGEPFVYN
jgi:bifunctional DNA-binding transcriptional regulator/antitoxin component of YhaV-PrlF toxin-antitoxin module